MDARAAPEIVSSSTGGQTDARLVLVWLVANNGGVTARNSCKSTAVTRLLLDVAMMVPSGRQKEEGRCPRKRSLLPAVDKLSGMLTFGSNESLGAKFVSVGISEDNTSKGSTTAAVMDDILYDATNVPFRSA